MLRGTVKTKTSGSKASARLPRKEATVDINNALSYALGAIEKKDICLKDEQELAIRRFMTQLHDWFGKSMF